MFTRTFRRRRRIRALVLGLAVSGTVMASAIGASAAIPAGPPPQIDAVAAELAIVPAPPVAEKFVEGRPVQNAWQAMGQVPPRSAQSDAMSKDLARRGFRFVGSTICYAFMQAAGLVNDHLVSCFRYAEVSRSPRSS